MSHSWNFEVLPLPPRLPHQTTISLCKTVKSILPTTGQGVPGKLMVCVAPDYYWVDRQDRKVVMSLEKSPVLDFPYIEAGTFKFHGQEAFILLEQSR